MDIVLTKEQQKQHDGIIDWYKSNQRSPYIVLGGLAGTGKTTILKYIGNSFINNEYLKVAFLTYTGKANVVLYNKVADILNNNCFIGTIHSYLYKPYIDKDGVIQGWIKRKPEEFNENLIIIDEGSMVNSEIFDDLLSLNIPMLIAGDYGQLPPIGEDKYKLMQNMDFKLTEIHRQALDNPIIKLSQIVRNEGSIPFKNYGKCVAKLSYQSPKVEKILNNFKITPNVQLLCGMNKTRIGITNMIRSNLGHKELLPDPGERIICLKNNKDEYIMNGQQGSVIRIDKLTEKLSFMEFKMDDNKFEQRSLISNDSFLEMNYNKIMQEIFKKDIFQYYEGDDNATVNMFDYGYIITVHKSQGSEWDKIILFDERNYYQTDDDYIRWLYTGITRAKNYLLIIGD